MQTNKTVLADPKYGLAWSNRNAAAESLVCNALLRGSFLTIVDAAIEQGMPFVKEQWCLVRDSDEVKSEWFRGYIDNMLDNIDKGMRNA